jgi:hypothetical protein
MNFLLSQRNSILLTGGRLHVGDAIIDSWVGLVSLYLLPENTFLVTQPHV